MVAMKGVILISTYPDEANALKAARGAVDSRLAACVNIAKIRSIYRWEGKVEDAEEYLALFKTTEDSLPRLKEFISSTHPYKVPEMVSIAMDSVSERYMAWMVESISS
ncbi:Divalent-cation tolerance protein CutA [archaeon HR05]|jgi:periplasmic divalent cation tolerance protein|uniref:Divalent-cation tolerance protein CutA n=2 Tax=Candidatus Nitrosocaldaceae TaxID=1968910 RepID=A0A2K5ANM7_9ARCH|nr:Divalent-cation tolerance protein CutA [archaeon HR05]SPC33232.1 Divalent-cation tolerance protein CutA [Candidatus Nitrosocaldus cavascurensis]